MGGFDIFRIPEGGHQVDAIAVEPQLQWNSGKKNKKLTIDYFFNSSFAAMSQGLFFTSLRQDIKHSTPAVHSGMMRSLPSDGIDAIEKRQIDCPASAIRSPQGFRSCSDLAWRKNTHERQKILWREVWYNI